jgi:hypothetical protein
MVRLWETASGRLRLTLMLWPPAGKSNTPDWIAATPEGYFDGSPAWVARVRARLAARSLNGPSLAAFTKSLCQPESVLKSWHLAALEPAKLTVTAVPTKPISTPVKLGPTTKSQATK